MTDLSGFMPPPDPEVSSETQEEKDLLQTNKDTLGFVAPAEEIPSLDLVAFEKRMRSLFKDAPARAEEAVQTAKAYGPEKLEAVVQGKGLPAFPHALFLYGDPKKAFKAVLGFVPPDDVRARMYSLLTKEPVSDVKKRLQEYDAGVFKPETFAGSPAALGLSKDTAGVDDTALREQAELTTKEFLQLSSSSNPEDIARAQELARKYGVDLIDAVKNPKVFEDHFIAEEAKRFRKIWGFVQKHPLYAPLVKESYNQLRRIEDLLTQDYDTLLEKTGTALFHNLPRQFGVAAGTTLSAVHEVAGDPLAWAQSQWAKITHKLGLWDVYKALGLDPEDVYRRAEQRARATSERVEDNVEAIRAWVDSLKVTTVAPPKGLGFIPDVVQGLGQMVSYGASAILDPAAPFMLMLMTEGSQSYDQLRQEGFTPLEAVGPALTVGLVNAWIEEARLKQFLRIGGVAKPLLFGSSALIPWKAYVGKELALDVFKEGMEEILQQYVSTTGQVITEALFGGNGRPRLTWERVLGLYKGATESGFYQASVASMAALLGLSLRARHIFLSTQADGTMIAALQDLQKTVDQMPLTERSKDITQAFVDQAGEDGILGKASIDAVTVQTYFQENGGNQGLMKFLELLGISRETFDQAVRDKGEVFFSTGAWVSKIGTTKAGVELSEKVRPGGHLSLEELKAQQTEVEERIDKILEASRLGKDVDELLPGEYIQQRDALVNGGVKKSDANQVMYMLYVALNRIGRFRGKTGEQVMQEIKLRIKFVNRDAIPERGDTAPRPGSVQGEASVDAVRSIEEEYGGTLFKDATGAPVSFEVFSGFFPSKGGEHSAPVVAKAGPGGAFFLRGQPKDVEEIPSSEDEVRALVDQAVREGFSGIRAGGEVRTRPEFLIRPTGGDVLNQTPLGAIDLRGGENPNIFAQESEELLEEKYRQSQEGIEFKSVNNRAKKELQVTEVLFGPIEKALNLPTGKGPARSIYLRDLAEAVVRLHEKGLIKKLLDPEMTWEKWKEIRGPFETYLLRLSGKTKAEFETFARGLFEYLRNKSFLVDPEAVENKLLAGDNSKAGVSFDLPLFTCLPDEQCKVCYAAENMSRLSNVKKSMKLLFHMLVDPEGTAEEMAREVRRLPKEKIPMARLLGSGDLTFNTTVKVFNLFAQKLDRPIHVFSRHHEQLSKLKGTQEAPFLRMGSVDHALVQFYGLDYLAENWKKRQIQNCYLLTDLSEIPELVALADRDAVGLVFPADKSLVGAIPDMLLGATCPCDAKERTHNASCRRCAGSVEGCFMLFGNMVVDKEGNLWEPTDPDLPDDVRPAFPFAEIAKKFRGAKKGKSFRAVAFSEIVSFVARKSKAAVKLQLDKYNATYNEVILGIKRPKKKDTDKPENKDGITFKDLRFQLDGGIQFIDKDVFLKLHPEVDPESLVSTDTKIYTTRDQIIAAYQNFKDHMDWVANRAKKEGTFFLPGGKIQRALAYEGWTRLDHPRTFAQAVEYDPPEYMKQQGFYSAVHRFLTTAPFKAIKPRALLNMLRKAPEVKRLELEVSGIEEWLNGLPQDQKVAKEDVLKFFDQRDLRIVTVEQVRGAQAARERIRRENPEALKRRQIKPRKTKDEIKREKQVLFFNTQGVIHQVVSDVLDPKRDFHDVNKRVPFSWLSRADLAIIAEQMFNAFCENMKAQGQITDEDIASLRDEKQKFESALVGARFYQKRQEREGRTRAPIFFAFRLIRDNAGRLRIGYYVTDKIVTRDDSMLDSPEKFPVAMLYDMASSFFETGFHDFANRSPEELSKIIPAFTTTPYQEKGATELRTKWSKFQRYYFPESVRAVSDYNRELLLGAPYILPDAERQWATYTVPAEATRGSAPVPFGYREILLLAEQGGMLRNIHKSLAEAFTLAPEGPGYDFPGDRDLRVNDLAEGTFQNKVHWGAIPNVLAAARVYDGSNERVLDTFFADEWQSDWTQNFRAAQSQGKSWVLPEPIFRETKEWTSLVAKRLLMQAAREDKDFFAWGAASLHTARWYGFLQRAMEAPGAILAFKRFVGEDGKEKVLILRTDKNELKYRSFTSFQMFDLDDPSFREQYPIANDLVRKGQGVSFEEAGIPEEDATGLRGAFAERFDETKELFPSHFSPALLKRVGGVETFTFITPDVYKNHPASAFFTTYDKVIPSVVHKFLKKLDPSTPPPRRIRLASHPESGVDPEKIGKPVDEVFLSRGGLPSGDAWIVPLTPKAKEALRTRLLPLFQKDGINLPRGEIQFPDGPGEETIIRIFENRNPSTILHELGHLILDQAVGVMDSPNVDEDFQKGMRDLVDWAGGKLDREGIERITRGFEAFLREGRAPTPKLIHAFSLFSRWLHQVYLTAQRLIGKDRLDPEIRHAFELWFGTQDEIEEAHLFYRLGDSLSALVAGETAPKARQAPPPEPPAQEEARAEEARQEPTGEPPAPPAGRPAPKTGEPSEALQGPPRGSQATPEGSTPAGPREEAPGPAETPSVKREEPEGPEEAALRKAREKAAQALDEATTRLVAQRIRIWRKNLGGVRGLKQAARKALIEEVPGYRAIALLQGKQGIPADLLAAYDPGEAPGHWEEALEKHGIVRRLKAKARAKNVMTRGDLLEIASQSGFETVEDMLEAMARLAPLADEVKTRAKAMEERMRKEFYALLKREHQALPDEAIHTDAQLQFMLADLEVAAKKLRQTRKSQLYKFRMQSARRRAREELSRLPYRSVLLRQKWLRAEARYAKQAFALARAGKVEQALEARMKQIEAFILVREAIRLKEEADKNIRRLTHLKVAWDKVAFTHRKVAQFLLTYYGAKKGATPPGGLSALQALISDDGPVEEKEVLDTIGRISDFIPEWIANGMKPEGYTDLKDLSPQQIEDLVLAIRAILSEGRGELKALQAAGYEAVDDFLGAAIPRLDSLRDLKKRDARTKRAKLESRLRDAASRLVIQQFLFEEADGFPQFQGEGPGPHQRLWKALSDAENEYHLRLQRIMEGAQEGEEGTKGLKWSFDILAKHWKERGKYFHIPGVPVPEILQEEKGITKWDYGMLISVALNMGNPDNYALLMKEKVDENGKNQLLGFTAQELQILANTLSAEEWDAIQNIWDTLNFYIWKDLQRTKYSLTGKVIEKVQARPFTVVPRGSKKPKHIRGGYYPLHYDPELSTRHEAHKEIEMMIAEGKLKGTVRPAARTAKATFERLRTPEGAPAASLPILLDLGVISAHLEDSVRYIAMAPALRDADRITRNKAWRKTFEDKFGREKWKTLRRWLNALAHVDTKAMDPFSRGLFHLRKLHVVKALGFRALTGVKQRLSLENGAIALGEAAGKTGARAFLHGWRYLTEGILATGIRSNLWGERTKAIEDFIYSRSKYMRVRDKTWSRDLHDIVTRLTLEPGPLSSLGFGLKDIQELAFWWIRANDRAAVHALWTGAYNQALRENLYGMKADDPPEVKEQKAIEYADWIIQTSQPSSRTIDQAEIQRMNEAFRLLTSFSTWMLKAGNRLIRAVHKKDLRGFLFHLVTEWFVPYTLMNAIAYAVYPPERKPKWYDFLWEPLYHAAVGWIPGLREIKPAIQYKDEGLKFPGTEWIKDWGEIVYSEGDPARFLPALFRDMEFWLGVPLGNIPSDVLKYWDRISGQGPRR